MGSILRLAALAVAAACALPVGAHNAPLVPVNTLPPHTQGLVAEFESAPGEDKEAFLLRLAPWLARWTRQNDVEACGYVLHKDGVYAVILQTQMRRDGCDSDMAYSGWDRDGETIHSHPPARIAGGLVRRTPARFSREDYRTPGYLVDGDTLHHQRGRGTERIVGTFSTL